MNIKRRIALKVNILGCNLSVFSKPCDLLCACCETFLSVWDSNRVNVIEETTRTIRRERSDIQGNELWYETVYLPFCRRQNLGWQVLPMVKCLAHAPYGKRHGCKGFDDMTAHFRQRAADRAAHYKWGHTGAHSCSSGKGMENGGNHCSEKG